MISKPLSRKANIVVQDLENEFLIYDLKIHKAFCLNETTTLAYQLCDGTKTIAEISDLMSKKLQMLVSEDFVWLALGELKKANLLENGDDLKNSFDGLSRREIVKKVGLASMIALPLITCVVAPTALMAQSNLLPLFAACSPTTPPCASGNCFPSISLGVVCCASNTTSGGLASGQFLPGSPGSCNPSGICPGLAGGCCSGAVTAITPPPLTCGPGQVLCQCN